MKGILTGFDISDDEKSVLLSIRVAFPCSERITLGQNVLIERDQPQEPSSEYAALNLTPDERRARMRKRAEGIVKRYPIADNKAFPPGIIDSRLLADEVLAYLDQPQPAQEFCECKENGTVIIRHFKAGIKYRDICYNCGKPVREKEEVR